MTLLHQLRPTLTFLLLFTFLLGFVYPAVTTGFSKHMFPHQAEGSVMHDKNGNATGSLLIGQNFTTPNYFWGRLSATSPQPYNASASSGSNYGSNNPAFLEAATQRAVALHAADPANTHPIPVDLVTASGSGLDPHISVAAAHYQLARVAHARGIPEQAVQQKLDRATEGRQFGILGEPRVNVLELNLSLDQTP